MRKWISVKDKLPERVDVVLAYDIEMEVHVFAYYFHPDKNWCDMNTRKDTLTITHWMPLPEPPVKP